MNAQEPETTQAPTPQDDPPQGEGEAFEQRWSVFDPGISASTSAEMPHPD